MIAHKQNVAAISCLLMEVQTRDGSNKEGAEKTLLRVAQRSHGGGTSGLFPRRKERQLKTLQRNR